MRFIYSKAFILFFVFLIITVIITFLQIRGYGGPINSFFINAPRPISYVAKGITRPVKGFFTTIYNLKKISGDNTNLSVQIYQLQQQLVDYDQAKRENIILRQELGFVSSTKQAFVPCTVITKDPLGLTDTLVINCGENQSISQGQAVISQGYLIGKIVYTAKNSSTVLLITSSEFSTDARLSKGGAAGVVKGSFGSGISIDQLSQNDDVAKNDMVVTAGINSKVPKNILIGQIGSIASSQNDLFKRATVLSPINFSNLEFVFVAK